MSGSNLTLPTRSEAEAHLHLASRQLLDAVLEAQRFLLERFVNERWSDDEAWGLYTQLVAASRNATGHPRVPDNEEPGGGIK